MHTVMEGGELQMRGDCMRNGGHRCISSRSPFKVSATITIRTVNAQAEEHIGRSIGVPQASRAHSLVWLGTPRRRMLPRRH